METAEILDTAKAGIDRFLKMDGDLVALNANEKPDAQAGGEVASGV